MTLDFKTGDIPTYVATENPFTGHFPSDDKTLILDMPGNADVKDSDDGKAIRSLIKRAREAANAVDRSVRVKSEVNTVKGKEVTTLTFWTVPRIERKRNESDATVPEGSDE